MANEGRHRPESVINRTRTEKIWVGTHNTNIFVWKCEVERANLQILFFFLTVNWLPYGNFFFFLYREVQ